jgi:hypothetical protein
MYFLLQNDDKPLNLSRITTFWIMLILSFIIIMLNKEQNLNNFYRIGPQSDLVILGIIFDNYYKYFGLILFSIVNTCIRNINHNIIIPWITLNIQNNSHDSFRYKRILKPYHIYEITTTATIYNWFDWLIYINILLAQIDLVFIEFTTDIIIGTIITYTYLK